MAVELGWLYRGCVLMRFVIKQVRPSGEFWLVRMSVRGVWGGQERARTFINRASAETCLRKLRPAPEASLLIALPEHAASGSSVVPTEDLPEPAVAVGLAVV